MGKVIGMGIGMGMGMMLILMLMVAVTGMVMVKGMGMGMVKRWKEYGGNDGAGKTITCVWSITILFPST